MSLGVYIAGANDGPDNPGGDGFMRLHDWMGGSARPTGQAGELFDEVSACGAILTGRRTVEQVDHWGGDHHNGVRIFVVNRRPPGSSVARYPLVTYVNDGIGSAMAQAKAADQDGMLVIWVKITCQRPLRFAQTSTKRARITNGLP